MTIGEIIRYKDIDTYRKLMQIGKNNKIKLGDKPENLMKHNSYKRQGRSIRQMK